MVQVVGDLALATVRKKSFSSQSFAVEFAVQMMQEVRAAHTGDATGLGYVLVATTRVWVLATSCCT